jgi:hypothetical protein
MSEAAPVAPATPAAEPTPTPEAAPKAENAPTGQPAASGAVPESGSGAGSAAKRLFKIQVEGQEEEVSEDEIPARLQKAKFHEKRSQELARRQSEIEKAMAKAKEAPEDAFEELAKHLGLDTKKLAEARMAKELQALIEQDELAQMTPEARKAHEDRKELERYRAAEKTRTEKEQADLRAKQQGELETKYAKTLDAAMKHGMEGTKLAGDPWAEYQFMSIVSSLAQEMMDGKRDDLPHPKQIAAYVEHNMARLAGKYAPAPTPAAPAKPAHPASKPRSPGANPPRDSKTGQFVANGPHKHSDFKADGLKIYQKIAENADKAKAVQLARLRSTLATTTKK